MTYPEFLTEYKPISNEFDRSVPLNFIFKPHDLSYISEGLKERKIWSVYSLSDENYIITTGLLTLPNIIGYVVTEIPYEQYGEYIILSKLGYKITEDGIFKIDEENELYKVTETETT